MDCQALKFCTLADNTSVLQHSDMKEELRIEAVEVVTSAAQTIRFQKVKIGRDFGAQIEIVSGLADGVRVAANPNDTLTEGLVVEPLLPVAAKK